MDWHNSGLHVDLIYSSALLTATACYNNT